MSASLWADIDAYLAAAVLADMGATGLYATPAALHIPEGSILVGDRWDPGHMTMPFVLIRGTEANLAGEFEGVDDTAVRIYGMVYPYELIATTTESTVELAKAAAQELFRRLREVLRTRYAFGGLHSTDGEIVVQVLMRAGGAGVLGRSGTNQGKYLAGAVVEFDVLTQI